MIEYNAGYNAATEILRACTQSLMDEVAALTKERDQLLNRLNSSRDSNGYLVVKAESLMDEVAALKSERDQLQSAVEELQLKVAEHHALMIKCAR